MGFFGALADRLKQGLERSRAGYRPGARRPALALGRTVDEVMLEELEEF